MQKKIDFFLVFEKKILGIIGQLAKVGSKAVADGDIFSDIS